MLQRYVGSFFHKKVKSIKVIQKGSQMGWSPPLIVRDINIELLLIANLSDIVNHVNVIVASRHMEHSNTIALRLLNSSPVSHKLLKYL